MELEGFNKFEVMERILEEVPIQTNLRREIEVNGEKRVLYAYYFNRGEPDPEVKYDRKNEPIKTTHHSTLCEIYSVWKEEEQVKEFLERGVLKEGEVLNKGPWLESNEDPPAEARAGGRYNFWHTAHYFSEHFNQICGSLGYMPRIISLFDEKEKGFFDMGAYIIQVRRNARNVLVSKDVSDRDIIVREYIGINLVREDPPLSHILDAIAESYKKIITFDFSSRDSLLSTKLYLD